MNNLNLAGVSAPVIIRGVMTVIAALNIISGYMGFHLIPISENDVGEVLNGLIVLATAAVWMWGYWKNNSFTLNAQRADSFLKQLKENDEC